MNITREHKAAWTAVFISVLTTILLLDIQAGAGNIIGAAVITYTLTVVGIAIKFPLDPVQVVKSTGRGAVIIAVLLVLLLSSIGRSLAGVFG
ncbi:hypothetical protein [Streptomyces sp. NPDC087307]|uniref:hypothetical protein n=1 Tax=Streptomyces sp. NPDC087307 TaxID=3365782 RepID=UPI003822D86B